jgi:hypothetical protein
MFLILLYNIPVQMVVLDGDCAVGCGPGMDWMVTVLRLWTWNGLDGDCAVGCGPGMDWMVTVLQVVGLE